ncbi:MAG: nucleotidyltransferase domain-containing protein [Promethearchaeota archaeon]|nr:MAG: nucleotidyltransferase domain-containing protein [Candidatus Lokiarchaeota archaeon]
MKKEKILREHYENVIYSEDKWALLKDKRNNAINLLKIFAKEGFDPYLHGSVARGDVHDTSDIDIIFLQQIPSFQVELILNKNGFKNYFREIIMATPLDSIKFYIHLSELESITLPLSKLEKNVLEFYDFGGKVNLNELNSDLRVSGIDKRLVLIRPTPMGHEEISIIGNEAIAAKDVGISINTLNERKKVLLRREKHGRTGVFLKRQLQINESTEEVLNNLAKKKSIIRKKLFKR